MLRCAGNGPNFDSACARFQERAGRCGRCRSCRDNIVDEDRAHSLNILCCRERTCYVAVPSPSVQGRLLRGVSYTPQSPMLKSHGAQSAQMTCQFQCLIESSFGEPRCVERHRDDDIRRRVERKSL